MPELHCGSLLLILSLQGTVVAGTVKRGVINAASQLLLGPDIGDASFKAAAIKSIHYKRLPVQQVVAGQTAALALKKVKRSQVQGEARCCCSGMLRSKHLAAQPCVVEPCTCWTLLGAANVEPSPKSVTLGVCPRRPIAPSPSPAPTWCRCARAWCWWTRGWSPRPAGSLTPTSPS
jgi:hypothetical protein